MTLVRPALVSLAALLLGIALVGIALNRLPFSQRPALATRLWPTNPDAIRDSAMRAIGVAAASTGAVPDGARLAMHRLARLAPLRPEPFLVEATVAATAGDGARAEGLYRAAASRDPRSVLAHYALADAYLRGNRLTDGLNELSIVARLVPNAAVSLAAPLASYARQPGTGPALGYFLRRSPQFAPLVLGELAKDPSQVDRVLALSRGLALDPNDNGWKNILVATLIAGRDYPRALASWRAMFAVAPYHGIYNPGFSALAVPPPFNWSPSAGNAALVEPTAGGLKIVYYGRENAVITQQMLLLVPGRYRLAVSVGRGTANPARDDDGVALAWQLSCVEGGLVIGSLPLQGRAAGLAQLDVDVSAGCSAQWLALRGTAGNFGQPVELSLTDLSLAREGGQ